MSIYVIQFHDSMIILFHALFIQNSLNFYIHIMYTDICASLQNCIKQHAIIEVVKMNACTQVYWMHVCLQSSAMVVLLCTLTTSGWEITADPLHATTQKPTSVTWTLPALIWTSGLQRAEWMRTTSSSHVSAEQGLIQFSWNQNQFSSGEPLNMCQRN